MSASYQAPAGVPALSAGPGASSLHSTDGLGCASSRLARNQEFSASGITLYRKCSDDPLLGQVQTEAADRGLLVGLSLRGGHQRRILHAHHASNHEFGKNSLYVRGFADSYRADVRGGFDFMLLEISRNRLDQACAESSAGRVDDLTFAAGRQDPVLANLMHALTPVLQRPQEACRLFVDQVGAAITTWLLAQYAGLRGTTPSVAESLAQGAGQRAPALSRWQESTAKEMLLSRLDGEISIAEVAGACNLSRAYFTRAFRQTTGETPHRWLLAQRVERACRLLSGSQLTLADIASACGFADQSHLTRVFSHRVGMPPGKWRRVAQ